MIPTVAAVSYLNALPLIAGLESRQDLRLIKGVPSSLLETLLDGRADLALCPVIDYQRSLKELIIVPAGAIGSRDRTLTVRVFSRREIGDLESIHVDGDSHTSIALLRVILAESFGIRPELRPLARDSGGGIPSEVEAALLIGDKVMTAEPSPGEFPEQLDLGEAWRKLTGLPFVFAIWMARSGRQLGKLPTLLEAQLEENLRKVDELLPRWAAEHGWPIREAREYLLELLDYEAGAQQLKAIKLFWKKCHKHGIIPSLRAMDMVG